MKRYSDTEIESLLSEADRLVAAGATMGEAARRIGVSESTLYRWRQERGSSAPASSEPEIPDPLASVPEEVRAAAGDPFSIWLQAFRMFKQGKRDEALKLYGRAANCGVPGPLHRMSDSDGLRWTAAAAEKGNAAAMYAMAEVWKMHAGEERGKDPESVEAKAAADTAEAWNDKAKERGVPAAAIEGKFAKLLRPSTIVESIIAIGEYEELLATFVLKGNIGAIRLLARGDADRRRVRSVRFASGAYAGEDLLETSDHKLAYTANLLRMAWMCDLLKLGDAGRDPLRLDADGKIRKSIAGSNPTLAEEFAIRDRQARGLPDADRVEAELNARSLRELSRRGLKPTADGCLFWSWPTLGIVGAVWFSRVQKSYALVLDVAGRCRALRGARPARSGALKAKAGDETASPGGNSASAPYESVPVPVGGWKMILWWICLTMVIRWIGNSPDEAGKLPASWFSVIAFALIGLAAGYWLGSGILRRFLELRDRTASLVGAETSGLTPASQHLKIWRIGWFLLPLVPVGAAILTYQGWRLMKDHDAIVRRAAEDDRFRHLMAWPKD